MAKIGSLNIHATVNAEGVKSGCTEARQSIQDFTQKSEGFFSNLKRSVLSTFGVIESKTASVSAAADKSLAVTEAKSRGLIGKVSGAVNGALGSVGLSVGSVGALGMGAMAVAKLNALSAAGKQEFLGYADAIEQSRIALEGMGKTPIDEKRLQEIGTSVSKQTKNAIGASAAVRDVLTPAISNGVDEKLLDKFGVVAMNLASTQKFGGNVQGATEQILDFLNKGSLSDELQKAGITATKVQLDQIAAMKAAGQIYEAQAAKLEIVNQNLDGLAAATVNVYTQQENYQKELETAFGKGEYAGATWARGEIGADYADGPSEEQKKAYETVGEIYGAIKDGLVVHIAKAADWAAEVGGTAQGAADAFMATEDVVKQNNRMETRLKTGGGKVIGARLEVDEVQVNPFDFAHTSEEEQKAYAEKLAADKAKLETTIQTATTNRQNSQLQYNDIDASGPLTNWWYGDEKAAYSDNVGQYNQIIRDAQAKLKQIDDQLGVLKSATENSEPLGPTTPSGISALENSDGSPLPDLPTIPGTPNTDPLMSGFGDLENAASKLMDAETQRAADATRYLDALTAQSQINASGFEVSLLDAHKPEGLELNKTETMMETAITTIDQTLSDDVKKFVEGIKKDRRKPLDNAKAAITEAKKTIGKEGGLTQDEFDQYAEKTALSAAGLSDKSFLSKSESITARMKEIHDAMTLAGKSQVEIKAYQDKEYQKISGIGEDKAKDQYAENVQFLLDELDAGRIDAKTFDEQLEDAEKSLVTKREFSRDGTASETIGSQSAYASFVRASQNGMLNNAEKQWEEEQRQLLREQSGLLERIVKALEGSDNTDELAEAPAI